jgi:hypothetical protein
LVALSTGSDATSAHEDGGGMTNNVINYQYAKWQSAIGDFNGDGKADLARVLQGAGSNAVMQFSFGRTWGLDPNWATTINSRRPTSAVIPASSTFWSPTSTAMAATTWF